MGLSRLDIYKRFKKICEQHIGASEQTTAKCFFVGDEFDLNTGNLSKGDQQKGLQSVPKYFYSEKWLQSNKSMANIVKDFPAVMLSPGDNQIREASRDKGLFSFDVLVYDTMFYDRNNNTGTKYSFREREDIWEDTEEIMKDILDAVQNTGASSFGQIYNQSLAADALGLPANPGDWDAAETEQAQTWMCDNLTGEYVCKIVSAVMPFDYMANNRLAGVSVRVEILINIDHCPGNFELRPC